MAPDNVHILYWLLGLSWLVHLLSAAVNVWDRIRLKPSVLERLNGFVDWITFNAFKKDANDRLDLCATTTDVEKLSEVIDRRFDRMSESIKAEQKTNQQLFRDLIASISRLEGAINKE